MKVFIRSTGNISPQHSLDAESFYAQREIQTGNRMKAVEPDYSQFVDSKLIRRMSRIVKMSMASAITCLRNAGVEMPDGIITGTAYGCLEDTGIFLRRMIGNKEEMLIPTAFIQSTHNTVGAQVALQIKCHGYNNTIVHGGFSFENALLEAMLLLDEGMDNLLVGAIDEITDDRHAILSRFGLYKSETTLAQNEFEKKSKGTIAGEGASFFLLTKQTDKQTLAELKPVSTLYKPNNAEEVETRIRQYLEENSTSFSDIDLILTGINGDPRNDEIYHQLAASLFQGKQMLGFKQFSGEYPTASGFGLWLAATLISQQRSPDWFPPVSFPLKNILIYNHYMKTHHSLFLVSAC